MFDSLYTSTSTGTIELLPLLQSMIAALVLGFVLSLTYCYHARHTKSFVLALAVLPAVVAVVIAMVNGNVGAGVAVAGAFSLVRFRSAPGSARDIVFIFLAMCVGLVAGMGYVACAAVVCAVLCVVLVAYQTITFGPMGESSDRSLRITVPEDLDFSGLFDDVLDTYCSYHELTQVRTTNMGSLFRLVYNVGIRDLSRQKDLIDELRCRNGNLEIQISNQDLASNEL